MVDNTKTYQVNSCFLKYRMQDKQLTNDALIAKFFEKSEKKIDPRTITRWRNENPKISEKNLYLLTEILDCNLEDLIYLHNDQIFFDIDRERYELAKQFSDTSAFLTLYAWGDLKSGINLITSFLVLPVPLSWAEKVKLYSAAAFLHCMNNEIIKSKKYCYMILKCEDDEKFVEAKKIAYFILGLIEMCDAFYEKAMDYYNLSLNYNSCVKTKKNEFSEKETSNFYYIDLLNNIFIGIVMNHQGYLESSKQHFEKFVTVLKKSNTVLETTISSMGLFGWINLLIEFDEIKQAKKELIVAKRIASKQYNNICLLKFNMLDAWIKIKEKKYQEAQKVCDEVMNIYPLNYPSYKAFEIAAMVYRKNNDIEKLNFILNLSLDKFDNKPCMSGIYKEFGFYYMQHKNNEKAGYYFSKALDAYKRSDAMPRFDFLKTCIDLY